MPITVEWDDAEKTILRYEIVGHWTWAEYHRGVAAEALRLLEGVTYRIDAIADFGRSIGVPAGAIAKTQQALKMAPPTLGLVIFTNGSPLVNTPVSAFYRVYRKMGEKLCVAHSVDQARALIHDQRRGMSRSADEAVIAGERPAIQ